jgi:hypothetical protein
MRTVMSAMAAEARAAAAVHAMLLQLPLQLQLVQLLQQLHLPVPGTNRPAQCSYPLLIHLLHRSPPLTTGASHPTQSLPRMLRATIPPHAA